MSNVGSYCDGSWHCRFSLETVHFGIGNCSLTLATLTMDVGVVRFVLHVVIQLFRTYYVSHRVGVSMIPQRLILDYRDIGYVVCAHTLLMKVVLLAKHRPSRRPQRIPKPLHSELFIPRTFDTTHIGELFQNIQHFETFDSPAPGAGPLREVIHASRQRAPNARLRKTSSDRHPDDLS